MNSLVDLSTKCLRLLGKAHVALLIFLFCSAPFDALSQVTPLTFVPKHRVIAHGDEFNSLAKSLDGQRVFIGTEKGDVIVWNLALRKIERTLHQPSAVHHLVALSNPRYIVAAGSNHYQPESALVRKWDVEKGSFEDLPGLPSGSFPTVLASEIQAGLLAVGVSDGTITVWDSTTNKVVATSKLNEIPIALAILGRRLYVAEISRESISMDREPNQNVISEINIDLANSESRDFLKVPARFWARLDPSPDHKLLAATYSSASSNEHTVLIEASSKSELGSFPGSSSTWINSTSLLLFDWMNPTQLVQISPSTKKTSVRRFERMQSDTDGRAFDLTGQVTNADGTKAWASYRKGPGFLEFDLKANKISTLMDGPSGAYAISVLTKDSKTGTVATGGADGYVRVWNLADLSLLKEYHVAPAESFVMDLNLLPDGRHAIAGVMPLTSRTALPNTPPPTDVILLNLETGAQKSLIRVGWLYSHRRLSIIDESMLYPEPDRLILKEIMSGREKRQFVVKDAIVNSAVSSNNKWLAVLDSRNTLYVFEVATGKQVSAKTVTTDGRGPIVITNDGRYVYQIEYQGRLTRWDTQTGEVSESVLARLREMHTTADFLMLAKDDEWLVTAGNHGDIGIFERTSGSLVCYVQTSAAAFYAEKAWLSGDRLIFTTDTGVMLDGRLEKSGNH